MPHSVLNDEDDAEFMELTFGLAVFAVVMLGWAYFADKLANKH